ncbi:hypothetical protein [Holospora undulata]|uniref:hypothetical protein n=1 Tax=Holospora undulata TaxID=1169117 RepID=UPI00032FA9C5|nr:hypothetical protein [Holospora undulata]
MAKRGHILLGCSLFTQTYSSTCRQKEQEAKLENDNSLFSHKIFAEHKKILPTFYAVNNFYKNDINK